MNQKYRQHVQIVLYPEKKDCSSCIRIDYADSQKIADLLAKYDNPAAIEVLKAFAEQFDINYLEFKELRYAVERLGGEWTLEKDFSGDALYRYEHPEE